MAFVCMENMNSPSKLTTPIASSRRRERRPMARTVSLSSVLHVPVLLAVLPSGRPLPVAATAQLVNEPRQCHPPCRSRPQPSTNYTKSNFKWNGGGTIKKKRISEGTVIRVILLLSHPEGLPPCCATLVCLVKEVSFSDSRALTTILPPARPRDS